MCPSTYAPAPQPLVEQCQPRFVVDTGTGEILSPNDIVPGSAQATAAATAPSLDDIKHPADRGLVKALAADCGFGLV